MKIGIQATVSCGVCVTRKSIMRLGLGLIENPKVRPCCPMVFVQLNSTDVSLECVHRLILLLVKHSDGTPGVGVALGFVNGGAISNEGIMDFSDGGVAPAMQVMRLPRLGLEVDGLLQELDCLLDPCVLLPECLDTVVHPTHLPVDVCFQLGWQMRLLQENGVLPFCLRMSPTHLVKMGNVEPDQNISMCQRQEGMVGYLISSGVKLHGDESFFAKVKCFREVSKSFFILKINPRRR